MSLPFSGLLLSAVRGCLSTIELVLGTQPLCFTVLHLRANLLVDQANSCHCFRHGCGVLWAVLSRQRAEEFRSISKLPHQTRQNDALWLYSCRETASLSQKGTWEALGIPPGTVSGICKVLWVPKEGMTALQSHSAPFCMIFKRCLLKCETDEILASQQSELAIISIPILCVLRGPLASLTQQDLRFARIVFLDLEKAGFLLVSIPCLFIKMGIWQGDLKGGGKCVHVSVIKTVCVLEVAQRIGQDLVSFVTFLLQQQSPNHAIGWILE